MCIGEKYDQLHTINRTGITPKMGRNYRPAHTANWAKSNYQIPIMV